MLSRRDIPALARTREPGALARRYIIASSVTFLAVAFAFFDHIGVTFDTPATIGIGLTMGAMQIPYWKLPFPNWLIKYSLIHIFILCVFSSILINQAKDKFV